MKYNVNYTLCWKKQYFILVRKIYIFLRIRETITIQNILHRKYAYIHRKNIFKKKCWIKLILNSMPVACKYGTGYERFYFDRRFHILWRFASSYNRIKTVMIICCVRNSTDGSVCLNNRIFSFNYISISFLPCWFRVASISVNYAIIERILGIRLKKIIVLSYYIYIILRISFFSSNIKSLQC